MSGRTRRILNLGLYDRFRHLYSLRRLDLLKTNFFHPTAEQVAAHGKVLPTLTPAEAKTTRISSTNLAAAEAAAPKIDPPKTELVIRPPQLDYSLWNHRTVHFLPTASESKVVLADRGNRMLRFDVVDGTRCIDTLPTLHGPKVMPMAISVPPTDVHLRDREDTGDLYIIDGLLYPHMAEERPQFEALVWRGVRRCSHRFWHCDILPLPPWITHRQRAFVHGHALVGDTICFSISGEEGATTYRFSNSAAAVEGAGTYCFHMATREWSKAGDWLVPFHGKADYVPELGLWFGISSQGNLPCAADLTGVVAGEEPPPEKMRIWARDDLPEEWQPNILFRSKVVSLGSGRFILMDNLGTIASRKGFNSIVSDKEFTLFTGMEVAFSNGSKGHNSATDGSGNESGHHNSATDGSGNESGHHNSSSGDENGGKGKAGTMCGLRMIKHKSGRHMYNRQLKIEAVF